jgi:membrane-associated protease RseP (regulator of RpoE activity)
VRVVDDFGFGLEGVVLTLVPKASARTATQVTHRDGGAVLRELPEPPYQLEAALSGFVTQSLEVRAAERELRIKLVHAASLAGVVTDSLGHPVPNALVSTDEGDATANTDARGNFVLSGVTPGALYVLAAHEKVGEGVSSEVRARGGETLPSLRIVLSGRYLPNAKQEPAVTTENEISRETVVEPSTKPKRPMTSVRRTKPNDFELSQRGSEVVFSEVLGGGAMERAGARAGDVLLSIDGEQVLSAAQGRGMLRDPPGNFANVRLARDKAQLRVRYKRPEL